MSVKCPKCQSDNPAKNSYCGKCGANLDIADRLSISKTMAMDTPGGELESGTVFASRYEIIEEMGRGGLGRVYRVFDKQTHKEIALKLLKAEIAAEKKIIERFRNEIEIARKITHKNVCRMHDLNQAEKTSYITMEFVRGEDLKSVIVRMGKLKVSTAISIARQIAEGLREAHKLGIVHHDLRPQNIIIDKDGEAKIMDFGIGRSLAAQTVAGERFLLGKPEYLSPEQVEGKKADASVDIYALGSILFEMITGRLPFEDDIYQYIKGLPPSPRLLEPQIPEGLNDLILRCLEKDRSKRCQTAEELLGELAQIEQSLTTSERLVPKGKPETMIEGLKRGDVVLVDFGVPSWRRRETHLIRPCLIVKIYPDSGLLIIAGIGRLESIIDDDVNMHDFVTANKGEGGLDFDFIINCRIYYIIHKNRILKRTGCLDTWRLEEVDGILNYHPPIICAARKGHLADVKELLEQGESVNTRSITGETPLHGALDGGHKDLADLLIAKGGDVNAKTASGITPLHAAAKSGDVDIAELLIVKGADVNAKGKDGLTPLHMAAFRGEPIEVKFFIEKGADVNAKDKEGLTPLHIAARRGNRLASELLINSGGETNAKNAMGLTPLDIAKKHSQKTVVDLLEEYETK